MGDLLKNNKNTGDINAQQIHSMHLRSIGNMQKNARR